MELTRDEVLAATGGRLVGEWAGPMGGVSTDSRTLAAGDAYVALRGETHDGHTFVAQAAAGGAGLLVVDRKDAAAGAPQLVVADTLVALGALARAWRRKVAAKTGVKVAAVVGSSGKTTTKEMAAEIIGASMPTLSTQGNLNNLVGLPMTLFRLTEEHRAAILELGMNQPGEAKALVEIAEPDLVCLTNIRDAHVGMFGSLEALYEGECESLRYAPETAHFLMSLDDKLSVKAYKQYSLKGPFSRPTQLYSAMSSRDAYSDTEHSCDGAFVDLIVAVAPYGYQFRLRTGSSNEHHVVELRVFGRHNTGNASAAAATASWFGVAGADIAARLTAFRPRLNRSEVEQHDGWWVLKDYYNAIPSAVESALGSMADFHLPPGGRRLAVLGDMMELGDFEREAHERVGRFAAAAGLARLICVGDRSRWTRDAAEAAGARRRAGGACGDGGGGRRAGAGRTANGGFVADQGEPADAAGEGVCAADGRGGWGGALSVVI